MAECRHRQRQSTMAARVGGGHSIPDTAARSALDDLDITGSIPARRASIAQAAQPEPHWPTFAPPPPPRTFSFETGTRYWYSTGLANFGFYNLADGDPTSTLDWQNMTGHSAEGFARITHLPTGLYAKGMAGVGIMRSGQFIDRDFNSAQVAFSDTTSDIKGDRFNFAMVDVGYSFSPLPNMRLGAFVGYHYWRERMTAYGLVCNIAVAGTCTAGQLFAPYSAQVLAYEPTWHAMRLGIEGRMTFAERWSFSAEFAAVPYASLNNKDSHLLRQSTTPPSGLGPAPNVITTSQNGVGVEAEAMFNYALTPNIEVGLGARYWGLSALKGNVTFGPSFTESYPLRKFLQQRVGFLFEIKGKF